MLMQDGMILTMQIEQFITVLNASTEFNEPVW